jgi:hypothetical protein
MKVVLLGAGFSRAISSEMPLMKELGPLVLERLCLPADTFAPFGGDVEAWLGHLGSDEPWLEDSDNLRSRALFVDGVQAVHDIIVEAQSRAEADPPQWLLRLVTQWSHEQATILTFNYDTLLERALAKVVGARGFGDLYQIALEQRQPVDAALYPSGGPSLRESPALYKLHGSINWLHGGERAPSTERFVLREDHIPSYLYEDLAPFVVPPASSKSHYYDRAPLRVQWKRAAAALRQAKALDVIGYSFPPSDSGTRTFLGTTTGDSVPVTLVDPSPGARSRLSSIFPNRGEAPWFESVEEFVEATCGDLVTAWSENVGEHPSLHIEVNGIRSVEPHQGDSACSVRDRLRRDYPGAGEPIEATLPNGTQAWRLLSPR